MVFFNHATRQMTVKIVYYGPGLCGKTTNLNTIYGRTSQKARGEMVSLNTETDRTLFFDLLPMDVGTVGGFKAKLQLYTVPGQVFYNSTRKLVLKGVDGIVFVADSQSPMLDANKESLQNLEDNLRELGMEIRDIPMVFQWNKRDLRNVVPLEQMEAELNPRQMPSFQSIAQEGQGVFETLRGITRISLAHIVAHHLGDSPESRGSRESDEAPVKVESQDAPPVEASASLSAQDLGTGTAWDVTPPVGLVPPAPPAPIEAPEPAPSLTSAHAPLPAAPPAPSVIHEPALPAPPAFGVTRPLPRMEPPKRPGLPAAPKLAAPGLPKPKLTAPGLPAAPGAATSLKVQLPAELPADELEVVVEVRVRGAVVASGQVQKAPPAHGGSLKIQLDLRRG